MKCWDASSGEQAVIIQGRDGSLRHVFEVDENGSASSSGTSAESYQEAIPEVLKLEQNALPAVVATREKQLKNTQRMKIGKQ